MSADCGDTVTPVAVRVPRRNVTPEPFVLDLASNPHPRMLNEALLARAIAFDSSEAMAYWLGYRAAMCGATGCEPGDIDAWMDSHS